METTKASPKVTLDWSKLLGFDQVSQDENCAQKTRIGGFAAKVGGKIGSKAGIKPAE